MKKALLPALAFAFLSLAGCNQKVTTAQPAPTPDPSEVERQVQARLAQERAAQQQQVQPQPTQPDNAVQQPPTADAAPAQPEMVQPSQDAAPVYAGVDTSDNAAQDAAPQQDIAPAEPQDQSAYQVFYTNSDLDQDGSWMQSDDYGYVWQPTVAVQYAGWRPYSDGHWVYTSYGWTWVSNERFGWATYHYGRWAQLPGAGWVWVPGRRWAPAWVSWRANNDFVGWAPLPPNAGVNPGGAISGNVDARYRIGSGNYLFVPVTQFRAPRIRDVAVNPAQNGVIINQTQNITHISAEVPKDERNERNAAINEGPRADFIAARTGSAVEKYHVGWNNRAGGQAQVNGGALVVPAPSLNTPNAGVPATPPNVKQHLQTMRNTGPLPMVTPSAAVLPATPAPGNPNAPVEAQQQWMEQQRKAREAALKKQEQLQATQAQQAQQAIQAQQLQQQKILQQQQQQKIVEQQRLLQEQRLQQERAAGEARREAELKQKQEQEALIRQQSQTAPAATPAPQHPPGGATPTAPHVQPQHLPPAQHQPPPSNGGNSQSSDAGVPPPPK